MRKVLTFEVAGINQTEIEQKALALYRDYMGDERATLPHNTVFEAEPKYEATGAGSMLLEWSATVHVSLTESS